MTKNDINVLDVRHLICPMTTVHVRLRLDNMTSGEVINILVKGEEPRRNVASSIRSLGQEILETSGTSEAAEDYCFRVVKA